MAKRIQLKRVALWKMPANTVHIGRGNGRRPLANPFKIGMPGVPDAETAVELHREHVRTTPGLIDLIRATVGDQDVACWCDEDALWCHGETILRVAAGGEP